jgi:phospholipase C
MEPLGQIKRVVGIAMENQSFDRMLGFCPGVGQLDGTQHQLNAKGEKVFAHSGAHPVKDHARDPPHGFDAITHQMWGMRGPGEHLDAAPTGSHCLRAMSDLDDDAAGQKAFMGCLSSEKLPAMTTLAREFVTCDRWFCSAPGPTSPNRMFIHAATSAGSTAGCYLREQGLTPPESVETVFECMDRSDPRLGWRVYGHDNLKTVQAFPYVRSRPDQNFDLAQFFADAAAGDLPAYSWLVPELAWQSQHAGGGGAALGMVPGDDLIADVYEAIRSNPDLWADTLLLITYDECGGYWDSALPAGPLAEVPLLAGQPARGPVHGMKQPWPPAGSEPYHFRWPGKRVPTILVSPHLDPALCSAELEHASIPASLKVLWDLKGRGPGGFLTARAANAGRLDQHLVLRAEPRTDCPATLPRSEYRSRPAVRADVLTEMMESGAKL